MNDFSKITGVVLLGLVLMAVTGILLFLFYPLIISIVKDLFPWLAGLILIIISFLLLWMFLYLSALLVLAIYYAISNPMEVKESDYSINSAKDSGEKQSGNYSSKNNKQNKN